jgi:hypothetical protein
MSDDSRNEWPFDFIIYLCFFDKGRKEVSLENPQVYSFLPLNLFIYLFSKTSSTIFAILFLWEPFGIVTVNTAFILFTPSPIPFLCPLVFHDIELYFIICWVRDSFATRSQVVREFVHYLFTTCSLLVHYSFAHCPQWLCHNNTFITFFLLLILESFFIKGRKGVLGFSWGMFFSSFVKEWYKEPNDTKNLVNYLVNNT